MTPDTIRRLAAEGYSMQLHTHAHNPVVNQSPAELASDLEMNKRVVERISGSHYHPIWTLVASCALMALGLILLYESVPILIISHRCREGAVRAAVRKVYNAPYMKRPPRFMRIEDI